MSYTAPIPPNPDDHHSGSPTIWQHVDRAEKAAKAATVLAAVALLIAVVALVLGIIAVTDDDERGDFQDNASLSLVR